MRSAGLLDDGRPAHTSSIDVLAGRGLDITAHRSRRLTADVVRAADLVLGMAREHVREAVVMVPDGLPQGRSPSRSWCAGARRSGPGWPTRAWPTGWPGPTPGARRPTCWATPTTDDVADPIGLPRSAYERMVAELDDLLDRLVAPPVGSHYERSYR